MSTETRISVRELLEYWNYRENLKPGMEITKFVSTSDMPPWDEICSQLVWDLYTVDGGYFTEKDHGYCGVYRLFALANENDATKPATIGRACAEDRSGTLYIGESGWLNKRLNQLRRSMGTGSEDTHGAIRLWRTSEPLKSKFPLSRLGIAMLFTSTTMHRFIERDLVRAYVNTFGDTPPLNCSY